MAYPTSVKGVLLLDRQVYSLRTCATNGSCPVVALMMARITRRPFREFAEELSIKVAMGAPIDSYLFEVIPGRHVFIVTYGCSLVGEFDT